LTEYSHEERAQIIRGLLGSKGWQMYDQMVLQKYEQTRDQFMLEAEQRHPDFKSWSPDKLGGMAIGLGWARNILTHWMSQYEAAQKAAAETIPEETGTGHPYNDEPTAVAK